MQISNNTSVSETSPASIPGDESIPSPYWKLDQTIIMQATPEDIWPWLVQMGNGRAGWYSYDWIDNLGKNSFEYIDSSLQNLKVGQKISCFTVEEFQPQKFITLKLSQNCNMTWALIPHGTSTELFTRVRIYRPNLLIKAILTPGHFIMQRKQFIELKKRLEK